MLVYQRVFFGKAWWTDVNSAELRSGERNGTGTPVAFAHDISLWFTMSHGLRITSAWCVVWCSRARVRRYWYVLMVSYSNFDFFWKRWVEQGLVNVPFWGYWTSPLNGNYRWDTSWLGDVQWWHLMTHVWMGNMRSQTSSNHWTLSFPRFSNPASRKCWWASFA